MCAMLPFPILFFSIQKRVDLIQKPTSWSSFLAGWLEGHTRLHNIRWLLVTALYILQSTLYISSCVNVYKLFSYSIVVAGPVRGLGYPRKLFQQIQKCVYTILLKKKKTRRGGDSDTIFFFSFLTICLSNHKRNPEFFFPFSSSSI